jgi:hypothetical protein
VEAPAGLGFACAVTYVSAVRRAGGMTVLLKLQGERAGALADFTLSEIGVPPSVVLTVGRGGALSWNGEPVTLDAVTEHARQLGTVVATDVQAPPGALELRPAREANFGQVYSALRAIRQGQVRAALLLPSVPPAAPVPAAPPVPPPAPDNQAAPAASGGEGQ